MCKYTTVLINIQLFTIDKILAEDKHVNRKLGSIRNLIICLSSKLKDIAN